MTNVTVDQIEAVRDQLQSKVDDYRAQIDELNAALKSTETELREAETTLGFVRKVTNPSSTVPAPTIEPASPDVAVKRTATGRVKSSDLIVHVIKSSEAPMTRDEIHQAMREAVGEPSPWSTPQNAINNAIARAVEKGLISALPNGRFGLGTGIRPW